MNTIDPHKCVILVPVGGALDLDCEAGLRQLEQRGYPVWRVRGYSAIDLARNQMATDALAKGFDELMWIDSDVVFDPNDVDKLRQHHLPLTCGIYAKKGPRQFACSFLPQTSQAQFGTKGGIQQILYCGFGFVLTRRSLYETMQRQLRLPVCNRLFAAPLVPYFAPMIIGEGEAAHYLSEDCAFCERARQCGVPVMADTTIRLWHVGNYRYGWEDAGRDVQRFPYYTYNFTDAKAPTADRPRLLADAAGSVRQQRPPRNALHDAVQPLPPSFPRLRAYFVSYPANRESLCLTQGLRSTDRPYSFLLVDLVKGRTIRFSRNLSLHGGER